MNLKPCPFCGIAGSVWATTEEHSNVLTTYKVPIIAVGCGAHYAAKSHDLNEAIRRWNTRAALEKP